MTEFLLKLVEQYGYWGVFLWTAFDHTGTPGAMLFSIGLASGGLLEIKRVLLVSFLGSLSGDLLLYIVGWVGGRKALAALCRRSISVRTSTETVDRWLKQYGKPVVIWGRFIAFVGRFTSLVLGSFAFPFIPFLFGSALGTALLVLGFGLPVYFLGNTLNDATQNEWFSFYLTVGISLLQIAVTLGWVWRKKRKAGKTKQAASLPLSPLPETV